MNRCGIEEERCTAENVFLLDRSFLVTSIMLARIEFEIYLVSHVLCVYVYLQIIVTCFYER